MTSWRTPGYDSAGVDSSDDSDEYAEPDYPTEPHSPTEPDYPTEPHSPAEPHSPTEPGYPDRAGIPRHPAHSSVPPAGGSGAPGRDLPQDSATHTADSAGVPARPRTDVVAVAALASGVFALVPLALAAGIVALARTRAGRRAGRPMAIAGIVLAGVWTLAGASVAAAILAHPRHPVPRHRPLAGTVFRVRTGQCVNTAPNGIDAAHVVPCSEPHDTEVYATFRAAERLWPGVTGIRAQASQGCASRLGSYLNPQFTAGLTESYVYPDRGAWQAGERTIVCEIHSATGKLTGSVRGLGQ